MYDELEGILTASAIVHRGGDISIAVEMDEILEPGEPLEVRAELPGADPVALEAVILDEWGAVIDVLRMSNDNGGYYLRIQLPNPGGYRVTIRGVGSARNQVSPVTTAVLSWPPDTFAAGV